MNTDIIEIYANLLKRGGRVREVRKLPNNQYEVFVELSWMKGGKVVWRLHQIALLEPKHE